MLPGPIPDEDISLRNLYDFPTSSEGWFLNIVDSEKK